MLARTDRPAERLGADGRLGNTRTTFPVKGSGRRYRYELRENAQRITKLARFKKCGRVPVGEGVTLKFSESSQGNHAGYGGLHTCGSVWACPTCSAKIAVHRKDEVGDVLQYAHEQGLYISMLTLTQQHHAGQSLQMLWDALAGAWQTVTSGRRWQEYRKQIGLAGYIKATEVTHGASGWHAHLHVVVLSEKDPLITPIFYQRKQGRAKQPYPEEITSSYDFIAERWAKGLAKKGVGFIAEKGGMNWQVAADFRAVGSYIAKLQSGAEGLAAEATLGGFKKARLGNRAPFQILADIFDKGEERDLRLWWEYETASHNRRALTWSQGLREWANLQAEKSDEEIAEEELGGEVLALFSNQQWKRLRAAGAVDLLEVTEKFSRASVYRWLDKNGILYSIPKSRE